MCDYVRDMWSWFLMLRELFSLSIIKCQNVPFLCFLVVTEVQTTKLFDFPWGKYLPLFPDMVWSARFLGCMPANADEGQGSLVDCPLQSGNCGLDCIQGCSWRILHWRGLGGCMLQCSAVMISHDNFKSSCHTRTSFYYRMYVDVSLQVTVLWVFVSKLTLELNLKMNLS